MSRRKLEVPEGIKPSLNHVKRCSICKHQYRVEMELEFLNGRPYQYILKDYGVTKTALYNHMGVRGLTELRNNPLIRMDWLIEEYMGQVNLKGSDLVRLLELKAKSEGKLGADNEVNVQQVVSDFGEKLQNVDTDKLEKLVEQLNEQPAVERSIGI